MKVLKAVGEGGGGGGDRFQSLFFQINSHACISYSTFSFLVCDISNLIIIPVLLCVCVWGGGGGGDIFRLLGF